MKNYKVLSFFTTISFCINFVFCKNLNYIPNKNDPELYFEQKFIQFNPNQCHNLYPDLMESVQMYKTKLERIKSIVLDGEFKGKAYEELTDFADIFGHRLSGSKALEDSIDYLKEKMEDSALFESVYTSNVNVPGWERGFELAELRKPRIKSISIKALGLSTLTPPNGIVAPLVVFNSYEQLLEGLSKIPDKIVLLDFNLTHPLITTRNGYREASENGALAVLFRSATDFSLNSVHTRRGDLYYDGISKEVPIAYITLEDSDILTRLAKKGVELEIYLNLQNTMRNAVSRNLFANYKGIDSSTDEFLVLAAHTDSWDLGQGVQDDAFAIFLAINAISILEKLGLRPRKSIKVSFWTAEEYSCLGSRDYIEKNLEEIKSRLSFALEADFSCLKSSGLTFNGSTELGCVLNEVIQMLGNEVSDGRISSSANFFSDLDYFVNENIPSIGLVGDLIPSRYFWFHHTEADVMTAVDSRQLDRCLALWTSTAYVLANLENFSK